MADKGIVKKPNSLNKRAVASKLCEHEARALIEDFMPFLSSNATRHSMRFDEHVRDDMLSIAMVAFLESIQSYNIEKGHFFPFTNRVVSARLIDYARKIDRLAGKTVSLDENDESAISAGPTLIDRISMKNYSVERMQAQLSEEIEQFKTEIALWGISIEALAKKSPKHKRLRITYNDVISTVINDPDVMRTITLKRYFPVKAVSKKTGLPHKKLERARTYVLAVLTILTGDYDLLSEYIEAGR